MLLLALLLLVAVWCGTDWLRNRPEPVFFVYALQGTAWFVLAGFAVAYVLARYSMPRLSSVATLPFLAFALSIGLAASYAIDISFGSVAIFAATLVLVLYCIAFVANGVRILSGRQQPLAIVLAILVAAAFHWSAQALYVPTSVWTTAEYEEDDFEESWEGAESLLFSQPERVDAAGTDIRAQDPARTDMFFVGFAGYGEQRVFAEEIRTAASVVAARYGSGERQLLLLNDRRDPDAAPLASAWTLERALRHVAAKMDVEQDVLFLALSSHGSEDWSLSVMNGSLPLTDLSAAQLAGLLDESGIKWRIVAISACYSGGFIEPLRNPYTIVIAAAAPDRTSFGCSDARDLTYFGEAFYRDSLPAATSLRDAFDLAKARVAEREQQEQVDELSDPRAWFGAEIERHLAPLEPARR